MRCQLLIWFYKTTSISCVSASSPRLCCNKTIYVCLFAHSQDNGLNIPIVLSSCPGWWLWLLPAYSVKLSIFRLWFYLYRRRYSIQSYGHQEILNSVLHLYWPTSSIWFSQNIKIKIEVHTLGSPLKSNVLLCILSQDCRMRIGADLSSKRLYMQIRENHLMLTCDSVGDWKVLYDF